MAVVRSTGSSDSSGGVSPLRDRVDAPGAPFTAAQELALLAARYQALRDAAGTALAVAATLGDLSAYGARATASAILRLIEDP